MHTVTSTAFGLTSFLSYKTDQAVDKPPDFVLECRVLHICISPETGSERGVRSERIGKGGAVGHIRRGQQDRGRPSSR